MTITERLSGALADRYKIERHLGEGGMATVYLAEDVKHDRKVALKVLRPELAAVLGAERFIQEIKTTANLQHPNILPLFDSGEADTFLYYVMPYIDGETIRDKLNRETQFGIDEAVSIAIAIADALDYAHRSGVIHRDIKPENILLHDGRPIVADFGIALAVSAAAGGRMTETGLSLGTPHYMSPEQATAEKELTARADIYSLGSVLYEMLTGEPPHMGNSAQQIIMKIVTDDARPITQLRKSVPPHVAAAVAQSLERLAADRFTSAGDFSQALANPAFTHGTIAGTAVAPVVPSSRRPVPTMALAAVAIVAIIAALWGWLRPLPEPVVSRFSVLLPADQPFNMRDGLAVSPDGRSFAYSDDNRAGIWIREMGQLTATLIPNSNDGQEPFFSPDGSRVAFYVGNSTWKVATIRGGPPVTATESGAGGLGGSWGADGFLYLDGDLEGNGLVRVLPTGGANPEAVTSLDTDAGETEHGWPDALPGGKGVIFTIAHGFDLSTLEIAVVDLETGSVRSLVTGIHARYSESGHLLYVTADGTLLAAPFDESSLELTGDPFTISGGLTAGFLGSSDIDVSPTGTLVYSRGLSGQGESELVWVDRDGNVSDVESGWVGNFQFPRLSPDGGRLAVAIISDDDIQVWVKELEGGPLSKFTFSGTTWRPAWMPDGRSIAYVSERAGAADLYLRASDMSVPERLLLDEEEDLWEVEFSPDGEWLVYRRGSDDRRDIVARHIGGDSSLVELVATEFSEAQPVVSPDGRWLAYISDESGTQAVYVRPFPETGSGRWQVSVGGGNARDPRWSADGRELFYHGFGGGVMGTYAVEVVPGPTFIMGQRQLLFEFQGGFRSAGVHQQYDVHPDGRFLMIRNIEDPDVLEEVIVVQNFFQELRGQD